MGTVNSVLMIVGLLFLIESCLVFFFPKKTMSVVKALLKDSTKAKKAGFIELLVAIALILIAINI